MKAFITGITGQDGSYLAELLLDKGYEVHGMIRRSSSFNTKRIDHIFDRITLHYGDMTDGSSLLNLISTIRPTEIYNLAAQSHVMVSFANPEYTTQTNALGVLKILEANRILGLNARVYQASSSEMFGSSSAPQLEITPFHPCSPYGTAKLYAHWICKNYRASYNMFVSTGILFNHESPRRGETFVTRKVSKAVANIWHRKQEFVTLGNLNALRDWGHAKDYVRAMWMMLQHDKPDDYIIATGETHRIRSLVEVAFNCANMRITWSGEGLDEVGTDQYGVVRVRIDPRYIRPNEVDILCGRPLKAEYKLNWQPEISFESLIHEMVMYDINEISSSK
jgi:GDPmannose 4,6-dehydratase